MTSRRITQNPIDALAKRVAALEKRQAQMYNNKVINLPIRVAAELPEDGNEGDVVIADATGEATEVSLDSFAAAASNFISSGSPETIPLDEAFETTAPSTFEIDSQMVNILRGGLYFLSLGTWIRTQSTPIEEQEAVVRLQFAGNSDSWVDPFITNTPGLTTALFDIGDTLEKSTRTIMLVSVDNAANFPVVIDPNVIFSDDAVLKVFWASLWGFRVSGPIGAYYNQTF